MDIKSGIRPKQILFLWAGILTCSAFLSAMNTKSEDIYFTSAKTCMDTLIAHGTDTYGTLKTPVFASILDVNSLECPENPLPLDEAWRVVRRERRNPAGANLLSDQPLIKSMYLMSQFSGEPAYSQAAQRYIDYYLNNLVDAKGLIWWGWHRHYDVYKDIMTGHEANWHEIHANIQIQWDILWQINPKAVEKEIESIWQWHVIDKNTGEINRHDDKQHGCDFTLTAGGIIEAFAFLHAKTNDSVWLQRARLIADYYWNLRNPETNLIPERPNAGQDRFDGSAFVTNTTGPYCHSLLRAYLLTKDSVFKDQAIAYLNAYAKYGYDETTGKFRGALHLDGTPIAGPRVDSGYGEYEPRGDMDLWEPYVLGYQYPLETAQCYALAHQITQDPAMLVTAKHFADWIEKTPITTIETSHTWYQEYSRQYGIQGTYAGKYGRAISFFISMYALTGNPEYRQLARDFADEAIGKLYVNGLFKGHPAKPYYETVDGVGILLYALIQLDQTLKDPPQAVNLDNW